MASVNGKLVCTIFDSSQIHTLISLRSSLVLLPDPENRGTAVGVSFLSCLQAEIYAMSYIYFRLMAAIFDFQHTQTSDSTLTCLYILPDPENMGISVGISLLSCIEAEMCVMSYIYFWLMAAIFDFKHIQTSDSILTSLCMLPDPRKHGYSRWNFVAILHRSWNIRYVISTSGLEAAILNFQLPVWSHSIATSYIGLLDLKT